MTHFRILDRFSFFQNPAVIPRINFDKLPQNWSQSFKIPWATLDWVYLKCFSIKFLIPEYLGVAVTQPQDILELKTLIEKHFRYTQSTVAEGILKDWDHILGKFIKVYPRDYRRVLEEAESIKNTNNVSLRGA